MIPLTLYLLVFLTSLGTWLLHYNNITKRFMSIIIYFMCFILVYDNNWLYILEYEIVTGVIG